MKDGGQLTGYKIETPALFEQIRDSLEGLLDLARRIDEENPMLFAVGDGNHSLATAKVHWESVKTTLSPEEQLTHPARHALVEIVNLYDDSLVFEPIHRVLFNAEENQVM